MQPIQHQPLSPSLQTLLTMAHFHGIAANAGDLLHRFSEDGQTLSKDEWLLAAKSMGLKARFVSRRIGKLSLLALPAVMWDDSGNQAILAKIDDGKYLIQEFSTGTGRVQVLSEADFAQRYSGKLILVTSRASVLGKLAKFDFTWFIPAVIKYRRIFLEVLCVSIVRPLQKSYFFEKIGEP